MRRSASSRSAIRLPLRKKLARRALGHLGQVDLACGQPLQQIVRRQVHQPHFVGLVEHVVGHRFGYFHAGHAADDVAQAVQVLHVHRACTRRCRWPAALPRPASVWGGGCRRRCCAAARPPPPAPGGAPEWRRCPAPPPPCCGGPAGGAAARPGRAAWLRYRRGRGYLPSPPARPGPGRVFPAPRPAWRRFCPRRARRRKTASGLPRRRGRLASRASGSGRRSGSVMVLAYRDRLLETTTRLAACRPTLCVKRRLPMVSAARPAPGSAAARSPVP